MNGPAWLRRHATLAATFAVFALLFLAASLLYRGFFSLRVFSSLFADNAFLGIAAVGMTLVIFTGGIDLSVGAVAGFTGILVATLIQSHHVHPLVAWSIALIAGGTLGAAMGLLIAGLRQPAFLITLAGMFLARGAGFWISTDSVGISHPFYDRLAEIQLALGSKFHLPAAALIFLLVAAAAFVLAHHTRTGRTFLAIGGNEQSALLMGLPVRAAQIGVYTLNGMCAAGAGIVATLYTGSGNPSMGVGMELDAIAIAVIGGAVLTGGRGNILGTLIGVLIFGTIQSALLFDGRLSPAWTRIVVGALLLGFVLLQRLLVGRSR
jgi:ribose/xylose/arabinose/galactoside ABC-type transport system permease subunit